MKSVSISTNQNGFTLIELLIVIAIIAVLASVVVISYNNIINSEEDSSALANIDIIITFAFG